MIYRIERYVAGKRGTVEPERVIAVTPDEVRSFLLLEEDESLRRTLSTLANIGILIRGKGRLTRKVRVEDWHGRTDRGERVHLSPGGHQGSRAYA